MLTSLIFVISLILLLRCFKSKRSRVIIGFLYCSFLIWYVQAIFNYGKYTLQPGQSVGLRVYPNSDQVEYSSELILDKKDDEKIKLTGLDFWTEVGEKVHYDIANQKVYETIFIDNEIKHKELENLKTNEMFIDKNGFVTQFIGEKRFKVTSNNPYTITITNVDDKPARFEAQVVDR